MTDDKKPPRSSLGPGGDGARRGSLWKWVVGGVLVAVVIWQVAHGVYVKSVSVPGAGAVAFYPKNQNEPDAANVVQQSGSQNEASVHGRHNTVQQQGLGNKTTVD
jgi:hypothetical protein